MGGFSRNAKRLRRLSQGGNARENSSRNEEYVASYSLRASKRVFIVREPVLAGHAERWCIHAMISHYDRRLGMSDAIIKPFSGMVDW
jgi:hypothetical protein